MARKILLASISTLLIMSEASFAQINSQVDDRFAPRIYGSTSVTPAQYSHNSAGTINSTGTIRVVEPVTQDFQSTILAAPTYSEGDVVRAQHFKAGDLSDAEYQALLDEADRIRAYQASSGYNSQGYISENSYTIDNSSAVTYDVGTTTVYPSTDNYEIELFSPSTHDSGSVAYADTPAVVTSSPYSQNTASHQVLRGDTLYNISKRYNISVASLKSANYMSDNNIKIGQTLSIPAGTTIVSENTYVAPVTSASNLTYIRNVEPVTGSNSGVYAVLPKDTLYSISRRACVKVDELISVNGISSPNALKPGQRLTMPQGHCLN